MDKEITDYINSTKNLKEQYNTGKIYKQEDLKELYKPITQPLKKLTDEIRQKTLPTAEQSDTVYAQIPYQNMSKIDQLLLNPHLQSY